MALLSRRGRVATAGNRSAARRHPHPPDDRGHPLRYHNLPLLGSNCLRLQIVGLGGPEKTASGPVSLREVQLNIKHLFCKAKAGIKVALTTSVNRSLISFVR